MEWRKTTEKAPKTISPVPFHRIFVNENVAFRRRTVRVGRGGMTRPLPARAGARPCFLN
jgi:hypothetical protein